MPSTRARAHGCRVLMNAAPAAPFEEEYIRKCHIFVVNEVEAGFYAEKTIDTMDKAAEAAEAMASRMGNTVIITMGSEGAVVSDGKTTKKVPSLKVKAVETTGAGDSFIGGGQLCSFAGDRIFLMPASLPPGAARVTVCRPGSPGVHAHPGGSFTRMTQIYF